MSPAGRDIVYTASMTVKVADVSRAAARVTQLADNAGGYVSQENTASRVSSDEAAITQLRALLSRAGSVSNLLTVQDQINSQESALEAMQAQQRALDHEVAYATVSLWLVGPVIVEHANATRARNPGFIGGITGGWKALVALISWLLSAIGAALPIGAFCVLGGYLGYRVRRGRRWLHRRGTRPGGA